MIYLFYFKLKVYLKTISCKLLTICVIDETHSFSGIWQHRFRLNVSSTKQTLANGQQQKSLTALSGLVPYKLAP